MPMGASILWPEKTRKSTSRSWTSTGMWGTLWAPSQTMYVPLSWHSFANALMSFSRPMMFETWVMAKIFVFGVSASATISAVTSPVRSTSRYFTVAPAFSAAIRQGSMLL